MDGSADEAPHPSGQRRPGAGQRDRHNFSSRQCLDGPTHHGPALSPHLKLSRRRRSPVHAVSPPKGLTPPVELSFDNPASLEDLGPDLKGANCSKAAHAILNFDAFHEDASPLQPHSLLPPN